MDGHIATSTPSKRLKSLVFSTARPRNLVRQEISWSLRTERTGLGELLRAAAVPQLFVFSLCGQVDRDVGVGVAPEIEKGLVGAVCRRDITHRTLGSGELEPGERTDYTSSDQATPEQHFLKLRRGCAGITRPDVRQASNVRGIERLKGECVGQVVVHRRLQQRNSVDGVS